MNFQLNDSGRQHARSAGEQSNYASGRDLFTLDAERLLAELRRRGARGISQVRLRENRSHLLSLSPDRRRLNAHTCFAEAPPEVLDDVARFVLAAPGSAEQQAAVRRILAWDGGQRALHRVRAAKPRRPARPAARSASPPRSEPGPCCATPEQRLELRRLYDHFNRERFDARLPDNIPLRLSSRMKRRLGHIRYHRRPGGQRVVIEIALQAALMGTGQQHELVETLLHEMAHVEAWLRHGHAGHGRTWKRIAVRIGCVPRACRPLND